MEYGSDDRDFKRPAADCAMAAETILLSST
jgi:hypothetical protein